MGKRGRAGLFDVAGVEHELPHAAILLEHLRDARRAGVAEWKVPSGGGRRLGGSRGRFWDPEFGWAGGA